MTELIATFIGKPVSKDVHLPDRSVRKHLKLVGTHVDLRDAVLLQCACHSGVRVQRRKHRGKISVCDASYLNRHVHSDMPDPNHVRWGIDAFSGVRVLMFPVTERCRKLMVYR
jgi:hypothetical protein